MLESSSQPPASRGTRPGAILQVAAAWVVAAAVTVLIAPLIARAIFVFFWGAVLFAAWRLGLAAAIAAAVAAVAVVDLVVLPPTERGGAFALADLLTLGVFVTVSALVSALAASRARAHAIAEDQTLRLQEQAVELELQADSAQAVAEELELATEQLQLTATEAEAARAVAEAALQAERAAADRASRLLHVTAGLSRARTPEEVADVIFREGLAALGAEAGTLALLHRTPDGPEFETVRSHGYSEALVASYRRFPLREGRPLSDAILTRTPRWLSSREAWRRLYPEVVAETGDMGFEAFVAIPVTSGDETLGAFSASFREAREFDAPTRTFLATLGEQCGLALARARAFAAEHAAREEAVAANRAKSQFLSTMSHELRTPLNAIAGYTELLEMGVRGPVTDEQREDLARIRRGAKVLMSLVNDVLNFARVEAGQVDVHLEDVRLDLVLADLEAMVAPQLRARRLAYALELADAALAVRADADRVKQILSNLLTNAVKFTDEGGRIVVSCDVPDAARATVRVCVRDSGRGIPDDKLAAIFEPFVQVDRHLTRDSQQGVGLGLAISRDLARAMGGELTVESRMGEGSTFALVLPRAAAAAG